VTELAAPAGDADALRAAVNHGADAVYLGLRRFNARARARNFSRADLAEAVARCRPRGVRIYVTLNTLVFDPELDDVEESVAGIAEAGADAVIVQDLAVARIARAVCPDLPIHASTQTSVGHPDGCRALADLGVERLVVPRELSVDRIRRLRDRTDLELEVFIHGALCVSWSGQCLASLARGGRSGNRGACAQPCRLPYDLRRDGQPVPARGVTHPLSPGDLWAVDHLAALVGAGVDSFKVEGRLKRPEYVASTVHHYRLLLDRIAEGPDASLSPAERRDLLQPFHRSPSPGYLAGADHRSLVPGGDPGGQGLAVGTVVSVSGRTLTVQEPAIPLRAGDGIAVDGEGGDRGGRVHQVTDGQGGRIRVRMGPDFPVDAAVAGRRMSRTDDPALTRRLRQGIEGRSREAKPRRHPVSARVAGSAGEPLRLTLDDGEGARVARESDRSLEPARERPLVPAEVRDRLARMGDTPFRLSGMDSQVDGGLTLPLGAINRLRRETCLALEQRRAAPRARSILRGRERWSVARPGGGEWERVPRGVSVLCRSAEQVDAVAGLAGVATVIVDLPAGGDTPAAIRRARQAGRFSVAALPRTVMVGEAPVPRSTRDADGLLVRNLAQWAALARDGEPRLLLGDASLNVVNTLTAATLLEGGLATLAPGADLDSREIGSLASGVDPARLEVILVARLPLFHTRHCLFAARLAGASGRADCGTICHGATLALVDREGRRNPVVADERCRNTVLDAGARDETPRLATLLDAGLVRFRIELADELADRARSRVEAVTNQLSRGA